MNKLHRLLFSLTIIFLPVQLGKHFWPEWSFVLGRRIDYLSPTLYLTDVLIFLTIAVWLLKKKFSIFNFQFLKKFLVLLFLVSINIITADNKPVAVFHWFKIFELVLFGYYIIRTKPDSTQISTLLSIAILCSSAIAIMQFFLQHSIGGPLWFLGERTFTDQTPGISQINVCMNQCRLLLRPYATFPHPNILGGFLAISLPLILLQLTNKKTKVKLFWGATVLLGTFALFLSFSRSAWVVGILGTIMIFIPEKLKKPYIVFSILIFFLGILVIKNFDATSESVVVRQQLNQAALSLWQKSPITGVGLGNFLVNLPAVFRSRSIYFLQPVHNIYLLVLTETGIIGFGFFVFFLFLIFKKFQISNFKFQIIGLLLLGLIDHYPLTLQQGQLLLTLFLSLSFL